jgi:hypothetical protein
MGTCLVALTVLLPDWVHLLRSLDRPLNVAPATETMLFALRTYAGVSLDIGRTSFVLGGLLMAGGFAMCRSSRALGTPGSTYRLQRAGSPLTDSYS